MLKMLVELNCRIKVIYLHAAFRMFTNNDQREHKLRVSCSVLYCVIYSKTHLFWFSNEARFACILRRY